MSVALKYCVYVLLSRKDNQFYIGFTTHLQQRLVDHADGKVESTAPRRPLDLVHCEFYLSKGDAVRREKYLKSTKGRRTPPLRLMLKDSLQQAMAQPDP